MLTLCAPGAFISNNALGDRVPPSRFSGVMESARMYLPGEWPCADAAARHPCHGMQLASIRDDVKSGANGAFLCQRARRSRSTFEGGSAAPSDDANFVRPRRIYF